MANNLIRFRETTSNTIQYQNWDLLDGNNQQKYEFAMLDFDMFDQWVHFVSASITFICLHFIKLNYRLYEIHD